MRKRRTGGWLAVVLVAAVAALAFYWWQEQSAPAPQVLLPVEPDPPAAAQAEPGIRYPIPEGEDAQTATALPPLHESDPSARSALSDLIGGRALRELFKSSDLIRNIVVTVDNLPRQTVAARLLPTKPAEGSMTVARKGERITLASENAARYRPFVRVAEQLDPEKLVASYVEHYPLFQRAYEELGYPNRYFNDRLVEVIDHMLAAPEPEGEIRMVQPHVLYKFADPELERASAGHKIMVRMGKDNEARVKAKLREIRQELTGENLQPSAASPG